MMHMDGPSATYAARLLRDPLHVQSARLSISGRLAGLGLGGNLGDSLARAFRRLWLL